MRSNSTNATSGIDAASPAVLALEGRRSKAQGERTRTLEYLAVRSAIDFLCGACNNEDNPQAGSGRKGSDAIGWPMSQVEMHPFEAVLRMCADAAPNAWHPERYARRSGVPLEQVNAILKQLWYAGLLEKGPPHPEDGPGLRLSAKGWEVLNDRQALRRLCADDGFIAAPAARPGGGARDRRAEAAPAALRAARPAYVTSGLFRAHIAPFLLGPAL